MGTATVSRIFGDLTWLAYGACAALTVVAFMLDRRAKRFVREMRYANGDFDMVAVGCIHEELAYSIEGSTMLGNLDISMSVTCRACGTPVEFEKSFGVSEDRKRIRLIGRLVKLEPKPVPHLKVVVDSESPSGKNG